MLDKRSERVGKERIVELCGIIKGKRELAGLDDSFVRRHIEDWLRQQPKAREKLAAARDAEQFSRSKEFDALKKHVRKALRESYGVFDKTDRESGGSRRALLAAIEGPDDTVSIRKLLATHRSTAERIPYYSIFYRELVKALQEACLLVGREAGRAVKGDTPRPLTFLDIGCGMHPLSYPFLVTALKETGKASPGLDCSPQYLCCDLSSTDRDFLVQGFAKLGIPGEAFVCDAVKGHEALLAEAVRRKPDVILLLKVLDTLETIERHSTKKLLPALVEAARPHTEHGEGREAHAGPEWKRKERLGQGPILIVSFATVSLGGNKAIGNQKRAWFEKFLERQGWHAKTFSLPNEKFYVIVP